MNIKILEKTVTLGDMKFKVAVDRDIAIKSFEEYPELIEYFINQQKKAGLGETEFFIDSLKNKTLNELYSKDEELSKLIEFALPLMLEKANDKSSAEEILQYADENNARSTVNSAMLKFLFQGFTQRELAKPTIKFSMK